MNYMTQKIEKAVEYLCAVMPIEIFAELTNRLKGLVIYLDTSVIYRLLNLQGEYRYNTVKNVIDLCRSSGALSKITSETYKELKHRIDYDAKVIANHPIRVDLVSLGYKYRSGENYVSTYWKKSIETGVSVTDFNAIYQNANVLLNEEFNIEIEEISIESESFITKQKEIYSKINLFDTEKDALAAWHDAYCFTYIKHQQYKQASNAIDSKVLFLTTDHMLNEMQEKDYELKQELPLAITPSQLLQIFSHTTNLGDYTETFVELFSSASISIKSYSNRDIQEILSRISHYNSYSSVVAERVLENQLLSESYRTTASDTEKEELVYNAISDELLKVVDETKKENKSLSKTNEKLQDVIQQNQFTFTAFNSELKEKEEIIGVKDNKLQKLRNRYVNGKWIGWKTGHICCLIFGALLALGCIAFIIFTLYKSGWDLNLGDEASLFNLIFSVVFGIVAIPLIKFGAKLFTPGIKVDIQKKYGEEFDNDI